MKRCDSSHGNQAKEPDMNRLTDRANFQWNGKDAMLKKSIVTAMGAVITLGAFCWEVCADSVPWGYSAGSTEIFNGDSKTSSVKFTGGSGGATGSSGIILYNMTTTSSASELSPDTFSNVPFDLAFTLTDVLATGSKSGGAKSSQVVNFAGLFSAFNVSKTSLLPGASPWATAPTAEFVLGADDVGWRKYTVSLSSFTSPGQPGGSPGSIQAIIKVADANAPPPGGNGEEPPPVEEPPPPVNGAPEPASLLLIGMGLPVFIALRRRKEATEAV